MSETKSEKTAVATIGPLPDVALANIGSGSLWLSAESFAHIQRVAGLFAASSMVPEHYRGNVANCAIAVQMALRLDVDPYMLMQKTYMVHGKPGMEAQMAIALVNARGPFAGPIQWDFGGQPGADSRQCTAWAVLKSNGQRCEATVTWAMAKAEGWVDKPGSKWKTIPDMMFRYRSATFLSRLYCPEVLMGLPTADELADMGAIPTTATPFAGPLRPPHGAPEVTVEPETTAQQ